MKSIIKIFAIIIFCIILIYILENNKELINKLKYSQNKKKFKILSRLILLSLFVVYGIYFKSEINNMIENIDFAISSKKNNELFDECDIKIEKENKYYFESISKKYDENFDSPYIFDGFKYVEGKWDTGFVIEDEYGNQYVWVPVYNEEKENVAKLVKKDFIIGAKFQKMYCLDDNYEQFIDSVLENGGFYISRYELGIEDDGKIVSKANKKILSDLTKNEMVEKINNMYDGKDFTCELINGYAYDTTIEWLKFGETLHTFDINTNLEVFTGRNSNKNIFDMFDNIFEYTRRIYL